MTEVLLSGEDLPTVSPKKAAAISDTATSDSDSVHGRLPSYMLYSRFSVVD